MMDDGEKVIKLRLPSFVLRPGFKPKAERGFLRGDGGKAAFLTRGRTDDDRLAKKVPGPVVGRG